MIPQFHVFLRLLTNSRTRIGGAHMLIFKARSAKLTVSVDLFNDSMPCKYDVASSKMEGFARPTWGVWERDESRRQSTFIPKVYKNLSRLAQQVRYHFSQN